MSIDLSKAKVGDKFRAREGRILLYDGEDFENRDDKYKLIDEKGYVKHFFQSGEYLYNEESYLDLVEQVFDDEKDTTDLEIVEAMNQAINENSEKAAKREQELQRRQEVVELAEKMYTMLEIENFKYYLGNNGNCAFESEELMRLTFVRAGTFINKKHQYLKEGKL